MIEKVSYNQTNKGKKLLGGISANFCGRYEEKRHDKWTTMVRKDKHDVPL